MNIEDVREHVTPEMMIERMRDDAQKFVHVAELVSLNREALALIVQRKSKIELPDAAALGFLKMVFDMLSEFASDLTEAANDAENGKVEAKVVDFRVVNEPTKH
jgi:hypothetical protein